MKEENTTSLVTRVLEWLPEQLRDRVNSSSTLLNIILNEVLSDRDVRITGGAGAARAEAALIAALHKSQQREESKRHLTLVVSPSREAEEIMFGIAKDLTAATELTVHASYPLRTKGMIINAFEQPADLIVSSLHGVEKLIGAGVLDLSDVRTVILDDIEWFEALGEIRKLARFVKKLPAARQLIGITAPGELNEHLVDLLHAPVVCRAPELGMDMPEITERLIVIPKDHWANTVNELAESGSVLYLSESPTDATRIVGFLKASGYDPKRVTPTQTDTAKELLILKFTAGLVPYVITSNAMLAGFKKASLKKIVQTDVPGGARSYLCHAEYLGAGGELVTVVTPEDLPLIEALLLSAQKKLVVENPLGLENIPAEVGQIVSRQKLTIRTDFGKTPVESTEEDTAPSENVDAPLEEIEAPRENRPYKRKNPKFVKNKFQKKDKFRHKPHRHTEEGDAQTAEDAPQGEEKTEETGEKKYFKKRFPYNKKRYEKRPYRDRQDEKPAEAAERPTSESSAPVEAASKTETTGVSERTENAKEERSWRPKTKYNRLRKTYVKDRRQAKPEGEESAPPAQAAVADSPATNDAGQPAAKPKKFTKYPQKKRPYQPKAKKPQTKSREERWEDDDDNFGNSIHYQPRRQNLRTLRSDEPLHWEPSDPFHPSSQALSLPQMMPDEIGYRPNRSKNDRNGNFKRPRKPGFKKFRGSGDN